VSQGEVDYVIIMRLSRTLLITWQEHPDQTGSFLCSKQGMWGESTLANSVH